MTHHYVVSISGHVLAIYGSALLTEALASARRLEAIVLTKNGVRLAMGAKVQS